MMMSYGYVYVASVSMGANKNQLMKAFLEAEAYDGPSLIIAYSHCINHGIDMRTGLDQQKLAVQSGSWPLYRFHPERGFQGENPLKLDAKEPSLPLEEYAYNEARFRMLLQTDEKRAERLMALAKEDVTSRWSLYEQMAKMHYVEPAPETEDEK